MRKLTVDELIEKLLILQKQGKGDYMVVPIVFNREYGHFSGINESWVNDVDDKYKWVNIGGE